MNNEIKILLASDVHLGLSHSELKLPPAKREETFKNITSLAKEYDIFLIGGDLLNASDIDEKNIDLIKSEFKNLRDNNTEILYTPGTAELNTAGAVPPLLFDLNASYVFSNPAYPSPFTYTKDEQKIYIYGIPASEEHDISEIKKASSDGFHIGLFHIDINNDKQESGPVFTLKKNRIKQLDLDFYALGHNHNFKMFKAVDRIIGAYPGSPQAASPGETGDRYVLSINIRDNKISHIKRVPVNSIKLMSNEIDCSEIESQDQILDILEKNCSPKAIQQLILTGKRTFPLDLEKIKSCGDRFFDLEILDRSVFSIDSLIEQYSSEDTTRGEFFSILREEINKNNIPGEIDPEHLSTPLSIMTKKGVSSLEEWLCDLMNA
ncbi:MAG: hypothetical protein GY754_08030 [bacterium]|nr:hypothetical protein [bacterium]